ncbi:MAG: class I fructose-bisphosphate aldolase [Tepidisphaerales bacterium]
MKSFRLNRLFNPASGRCFDVAVDHGFFDDIAFLSGIEDLGKAVRTLVEAGPDAIQLTPGQAHLLQSIPGKAKPALVLRVDTANVYGRQLPDVRYNEMIAEPIATAVRLDAACICINLFKVPGAPEIQQQCIRNIMSILPEAHRLGMPVMVEPLVARDFAHGGGYLVDGDASKIIPLVRQAVELGADVIKADPTDDPADYPKVIQAAGSVPVLVRGGGRVADDELLRRTEAVLKTGARGIVYGRNVIQHPNPYGITRALMAMVHEHASAADAAKLLTARP